MKIVISFVITAFVLVSCNQKNAETRTVTSTDTATTVVDTTMNHSEVSEKLYSCSMHPEVQGKLNDKCSKCGMKLTEPVTENSEK